MKQKAWKFQIKRRSLIAGFRFLLWWGAETMRSIMTIPANEKEIQFVSHQGSWPISFWYFIRSKTYCLIYKNEIPEIRIIALPKIQMN